MIFLWDREERGERKKGKDRDSIPRPLEWQSSMLTARKHHSTHRKILTFSNVSTWNKANNDCYYSMEYWRNWWHKLSLPSQTEAKLTKICVIDFSYLLRFFYNSNRRSYPLKERIWTGREMDKSGCSLNRVTAQINPSLNTKHLIIFF